MVSLFLVLPEEVGGWDSGEPLTLKHSRGHLLGHCLQRVQPHEGDESVLDYNNSNVGPALTGRLS